MWNWIVSFDQKMKEFQLYRMISIVPRLLYRLLMRIRNLIKQLSMLLKEKIDEIQHFLEEHTWEKMKARERERYLKEGGRCFPVVSVIMPVYNAQKYLEEALDSLLNQSVSYFEVIAVDDGSTDESLQILQSYAKRDARIRVFHQKNKYAGTARNLGMKKAKGRYFLFLDADDTFEFELIEKTVYAAVENDADLVLFGANYYHMQNEKRDYAKWLLNESLIPETQPFSWKDCPESIFQISTAVPWTKLFKRSFIRKTRLKFQPLHNANDVFFCYSAMAMAQRIVTLNDALVTYRMGMTTNLQSTSKRCFDQAYLAWKNQLKKIGIYSEVKRSYANAALSSTLYNLSKVQDEQEQRKLYMKIKNELLDQLELKTADQSYYYDQKKAELLSLIEHEEYEAYRETIQQ